MLANPMSEMRLIIDSMTRSNLTRKPKARAALDALEYNQIVTETGD